MEASIRTRLKLLVENVKTNIELAKAQIILIKQTESNIDDAKIISSKLKSSTERLVAEIYNYYRMVTEPCADEMIQYTEIQIAGEDLGAELNVLIEKGLLQKPTNTTDKGQIISGMSKLPKMELGRFNGDVLKWYQFWDQFSSNVDSRNIAAVDKLLYLQSALDGEAKRSIEGLETTNKNYEIAVNTLKERYGKTDIIIDAHYAALYRIRTSNDTVVDHRRVFNEIERHLRVLKSLGEDVNHNHLRVIIMQKFSEDLIYELRMKMSSDTDTIENIRTHLERIISAREASSRMKNEVRGKADNGDSVNSRTDRFTLEALHTKTDSNKRSRNHFRQTDSPKYSEKRPKFEPRNKEWANKSNRSEKDYNARNRKREFNSYQDARDSSAQRNEEPENKRRKPSCIFCGNSHYNDECNLVTTLSDRKKKLEGRCFKCFGKGHRSHECKSTKSCRHCGKKGSHNRALCPTKLLVKTDTKTNHVNSNIVTRKPATILQTAVARISNGIEHAKDQSCRILLDCGSQRSYITKELAKKLKLDVKEIDYLSIFTFGADRPKEVESALVEFYIETKTKNRLKLNGNIVPHITNSIANIGEVKPVILDMIPNHFVLADDSTLGNRIDLLIGNDYYNTFISGEKLTIAENLHLINSRFGWILSGSCELDQSTAEDELSVVTYVQADVRSKYLTEPDLPLRLHSMKTLWDLEAIGITDSPKVRRDDEAIKHFNETTQYIDNRYQVKWPWIDYPPMLPSNYGLAYGRLISLMKRLDRDTKVAYDKVIREQIDKGIVETVTCTEDDSSRPIHYLPHHCVAQNNKLRVVYDASAKSKDAKSLNECLYRGPLMLEDLTGLLIRFREHQVGIVADVEKAFLQIGLQKEDRDVTRFLWLKDANKGVNNENLLHLRFNRVPFGIISSPFLLNATVQYHLTRKGNPFLKQIAQDLYVDNLVTGTNSTENAVILYDTCKKEFEDLAMNLRDWNSNSAEFKMLIPEEHTDKETEHTKVLGLDWSLQNDMMHLRVDIDKLLREKVTSKREVLRMTASIFDPCGFAVPIVLEAKLFLQKLWNEKIQWDTKLPEELIKEWETIATRLKEVEKIAVPRCFFDKTRDDVRAHRELHVFTDSSLQAYAAVVYLRTTNKDKTRVSFVIGKSRLVAQKDQSDLQIPKLELLGALIGSRLIKYVQRFLRVNVDKLYLWTDSQIVISWIYSSKLLPPFISKRIEEIKLNNDLCFRYVPTQLNPADTATRVVRMNSDTNQWLKGPEFLTKEPSLWPERFNPGKETKFLEGPEGPSDLQMMVEEELENRSVERDEEIDDKDKRKSGERPHVGKRQNAEEKNDEMSLRDTDLETLLELQRKYYPKEVMGKETDVKRSLRLFKDRKGLLRCEGRFSNSDLPEDQRYPILIPKDAEFTTQVIEDAHKSNYHVGVSHTLSLLRKKYWVPHGRSQVQKVLKRCLSCRKHGGGPYKLPPMASLPTERVTYSIPFTYTGIDYFGPFLVSDNGKQEKRWVCLYTCLAIRAIHLEVVGDSTAEECLMALRRFISARGIPKLIVSDNALQFKLTAEVVTNQYCIINGIRWKFIPELAPWFGGFYERLIGIVKHCLKRTLDKHLLNSAQLQTIMKEIEAVVNTRPLTTVGQDIEHVLSPADFLGAKGLTDVVISDEEFTEPATITKSNLIESWKRGQFILKEYIEMFRNQYLSCLRERSTAHREPRVLVDRVPMVGDIVQIKNNSNRTAWKVGKITEVVKGTDGHIRVAKVKTSPNETLTRSIAHLYPLEIDESDYNVESPASASTQTQIDVTSKTAQATDELTANRRINQAPELELSDSQPQAVTQESSRIEAEQSRPKRGSAQRALEKIRLWTAQLMILDFL